MGNLGLLEGERGRGSYICQLDGNLSLDSGEEGDQEQEQEEDKEQEEERDKAKEEEEDNEQEEARTVTALIPV